MIETKPTRRNRSIQILRIIACIMVLMVHFGQRVDLTGTARSLTDFGMYGVHLFFLLSGYLAASSIVDNPKFNLKTYYIKRAVAILPLYFLVIVYYFITENILNQYVAVIPSDELGIGWLRYIFLLNGFLNSDTYFWSNLGITWAIPIFAFFYLIAPLILKRVHRLSSALAICLTVFGLSSIVSRFYSCTIFENLRFLFLGVVVYFCIYKNRYKGASLVFMIAALMALILQRDSLAYSFIFASIMLIFITCENNYHLPIPIQKAVDSLDKYSYTLYLMHGVVFCSLLDRLRFMGVHRIIIAALALIGTAAATFIVGKFIEKPIQSFLKKIFKV